MISPVEYIKRKALLSNIKKKYDIELRLSLASGNGSYRRGFIDSKEEISLCIYDKNFYLFLFHELGHLMDYRLRNKHLLIIGMTGRGISDEVFRSCNNITAKCWRGEVGQVLKEEYIASKNGIRIAKAMGIEIDKKKYLEWFNNYTKVLKEGFTIPSQHADIHYQASNCFK